MKKKTDAHIRKRQRASYAVRKALGEGLLKRQPCERCGAEAMAHHEDYDKPLDVMWLCRKHHHERHQEIGLPMHPRGPHRERRMPNLKAKRQLITPKQAGELLGFKSRTISRWCREGGVFESARKVGRVWRISAEEVQGMVERRQ